MIEHVGYLISSCKGYERPLQHLLMSMQDVARRDIRVVVGGHEERSTGHMIMVDHTYVWHNSYDYTALIDFATHPEDYPDWSHVFVLQDTMQFGPQTHSLIHQADPAHKATAVWGGQCNLMLLRADYLRERVYSLRLLRDCSKQAAIRAEGYLWRQLPEAERGTYPGGFELRGDGHPYAGALRQQEYYSGVDLIKWKANWGQNTGEIETVFVVTP